LIKKEKRNGSKQKKKSIVVVWLEKKKKKRKSGWFFCVLFVLSNVEGRCACRSITWNWFDFLRKKERVKHSNYLWVS
jgi:hypothetical protein